MKFDISKDKRQDKALNKWRINKGIGTIKATPRFGKTAIGLKAETLVHNKFNNGKILILAPTEYIENLWKNQVKFATVTTRFKINPMILSDNYILVIIDEIHKYTTPREVEILKLLADRSKFRMGLTGSEIKDSYVKRLYPIIDSITEQESIENNWTANYSEYNLSVEFTDDERDRYERYSDYITETLNMFNGKSKYIDPEHKFIKNDLDYLFKLHAGLTINGKYIPGFKLREQLAEALGWSHNMDLTNENNRSINHLFNPNSIYERVKSFKNIMGYRKELINNNEAKIDAVVKIIQHNDVPTIIFNDSIEIVNKITDRLGYQAVAYHSKIEPRYVIGDDGEYIKFKNGKPIKMGKKRLKDYAIKQIQNGSARYLVTTRMLDEGLDLPELEQVIITSGSLDYNQQQQRTARAKTINDDKVATIINVFIDDYINNKGISIKSRDRTKLDFRQSRYKHSVIWVNYVQEIKGSIPQAYSITGV